MLVKSQYRRISVALGTLYSSVPLSIENRVDRKDGRVKQIVRCAADL